MLILQYTVTIPSSKGNPLINWVNFHMSSQLKTWFGVLEFSQLFLNVKKQLSNLELTRFESWGKRVEATWVYCWADRVLVISVPESCPVWFLSVSSWMAHAPRKKRVKWENWRACLLPHLGSCHLSKTSPPCHSLLCWNSKDKHVGCQRRGRTNNTKRDHFAYRNSQFWIRQDKLWIWTTERTKLNRLFKMTQVWRTIYML